MPGKVWDEITYTHSQTSTATAVKLRMNKSFNLTLDNGYDDLSALELKVIPVNEIVPDKVLSRSEQRPWNEIQSTFFPRWVMSDFDFIK